MKEKIDRFWPVGNRQPETATEACFGFIGEHSRMLDFLVFFHTSRERALISRKNELKALKKSGDKERHERALKDREDFWRQLDEQEELLYEVVLVRVVDNFLTYLVDLLTLIYRAKPDMLKSGESETLDFILQHRSMEELQRALAEKRVERLAYKGLKELSEYVSERMGFDLFEDEAELNRIALIVEYRNLLVHTRGVVSPVSIRRFPSLAPQLGKRLKFGYQDVTDMRGDLEGAVFSIDHGATAKFKLSARALP